MSADANLTEPLPAGAPKPGEIFAEKYRIEQVLGVGGMGYVLAATHLQLHERVAIKMLLPERASQPDTVARFLREGRASVKIRSEHVARVLDVGSASGTPYIVMEYLDGSDLAGFLRHHKQLSVATAVDYLLQACEAIAEAHAMQTVHRDLKPANLFIVRGPDGRDCIKVLDFGISKSLAAGEDEVAMTKTTATVGTPRYMSPEQLKSSKDVDARADIWALGIILFELIAGRPPFRAQSIAELGAQVLTANAADLRTLVPDAPAPLAEAIARCLRRDPRERFPSVAELAAALAPFGTPSARTSAERISQVLAHVSRPDSAPILPVGAGGGAGGVLEASAYTSGSTTNGTWGTMSSVSGASMGTDKPARARGSLVTWIGAGVVALAIVGGGVGVLAAKLSGRSPAASSSSARPETSAAAGAITTASTSAAAATTPSNAAPVRTVQVAVDAPPDSKVDVDGAPIEVRDGKVELRGPVGSVHRVRVVAGGRESKVDVAIAESGPIPARVELAHAPSVAAKPTKAGTKPAAASGDAPKAPERTPPAAPSKPPAGVATINRNF